MKITSVNRRILFSVVISSCALLASCESDNVKNNVPKEILDIFSKKNDSLTKNEATPAGPTKSGNKIFAEGSSISLKEQASGELKEKSSGTTHHTTAVSDSKSITQSLNITTLDFLTNSEETSHGSGTSSIKPRKGVHFSKIVPKKGVNFEDFMNYSLPMDHSCFVVNQTNCYDMDYYKNLVCSCCDNSNELGKMISHQPLTNCSTCIPLNKLSVDFSQPCSGICCDNITLSSTMKSITNKTESTSNRNSNDYQVFEAGDKLSSKTVKNNSDKRKHKPTVTNVPYDYDINNPFSKSKGEKYVPIIVSIFVLPLAGILVFVTWRKTRELWERRYYRRMDFLIDGMYNE